MAALTSVGESALSRIDELIRSDQGGVLTVQTGADRAAAAAHAARRARALGRRVVAIDGAASDEPWRDLALALGLREPADALATARRIRHAAAGAVLVVSESARTTWGSAVCDELARLLSLEPGEAEAAALIVLSERRARAGATVALPEASTGDDLHAYLEGLVDDARARVHACGSLHELDAWWRTADTGKTTEELSRAPADPGDAWSKLRAAEHHAAAGERDAAIAAGRAAIAAAPDALSRADLWRRLERALGDLLDDRLAAELAEQALAWGDVEQAHRLVAAVAAETAAGALLEGRVALARGDHERARRAYADAEARAADRAERCAVTLARAELALLESEREAARDLARAALGLADAAEQRLAARNALGKVLLAEGDWPAAEAHFAADERAAADADRRGDVLRARLNRAIAVVSAGRRVEGAALLESLLADGEGHDEAVAFALANLGWLAAVGRDYAAAIACCERSIAALRVKGDGAQLARQLMNLADLYVRVGKLAEAEQLLASARCAAPLGADLVVQLALSTAELRLAAGDAAAAGAAADEAITRAAGSQNGANRGHALRVACRAALEQGEIGRAALLLERARQAACGPNSEAVDAWLTAAVAQRRDGEYAELAAQALAQALEAGDGEMIWRARELSGHAALDEGDRARALEHYEQAIMQRDALARGLPEPLRSGFLGGRELRRLDRLAARLEGAGSRPALRDAAPSGRGAAARLVGDTPAMRALKRAVAKIGPSQATVLIAGESGTGKELVAEALHAASDRAAGPLVKVNCAALVETLLMSELFGHEKGAFTGAHCKKRGRFEQAHHGTIFLDEIGDISPTMQVSLLRVLQERSFERVGGTTPIEVDVRIVCATHRDLRALVADGRFREDLYYRLCGVTMQVPALRERLDDLPLLAAEVLDRIAAEHGELPKRLADDALAVLRGHRWPGNVRELCNALRAAALFAEGPAVRAVDLTGNVEALRSAVVVPPTDPPSSGVRASAPDPIEVAYAEVRDRGVSLPDLKKLLERACIERALDDSDGNVTHAARLLGMKRPRLSQLVNQYAREAEEVAS
jgi:DNA-binding NtrC family response regulator